jgi:type I restriction enzyme M protein
VLANGSLSSKTGGEGEIRQRLVDADLVDCIVAMPDRLFFNTGIPVSLWFVSKNREGNGHRRRAGEVLFIDARGLGTMETRRLRILSDEEICRVSGAYHSWRNANPEVPYEDVPGFCKAASLDVIRGKGYVLTPGRYVDAAATEASDEPVAERISRLRGELLAEFNEGRRLEQSIRDLLEGLE